MSAAMADTTVSGAGGCRAHRRSPRVRKLAQGLRPVADVGGRRHLGAGLHRVMTRGNADEDLNWVVSVDWTIVRTHQQAAGARRKGPRPASPRTMPPAAPTED